MSHSRLAVGTVNCCQHVEDPKAIGSSRYRNTPLCSLLISGSICSLLDVEDRIHQKNWMQVAEKGLGLNFAEIRYIRDLKESAGRSSIEKLLDRWTEKGKNTGRIRNIDERNRIKKRCCKTWGVKTECFLIARDTPRITKNSLVLI